MAIAHDASVESHTGTTGSTSEGSFQWTHTPTGTPAAVLVFVYNLSSSTDTVTSVTYGGVTVPAVSGGRAQDTAGEPGSSKAFFLGDISLIATGNQTVVVTRTNNTDVMYAVSITVTAASGYSTAVAGVTLTEGDGTVAEVAVTDNNALSNSLRYAGGYFGHQTLPSTGASSTALQSIDVGANGAVTVRETTAGTGSRSVGMSSGTSDDRAIVTLAVREVIQAAKGALTLSGQAISLAAGVVMAATALTFTGQAPTVTVAAPGVTMAPAAGSLAFTGTGPAIAFHGPDTGALAFTGQTPVSLIDLPRAPAAGALTITGQAVTVSSAGGGGVTLSPAAGTLTLSGQTPVASLGLFRSPAIGALTVSGLSPTLDLTNALVPSQAPLALTGQSVSLAFTGQSVRTPAAGTLVLTGTGPAIAFTGPSTGALTLTGQAVNLGISSPIRLPAAGTLTFSGQLPVLVQSGGNTTLTPAVGALAFTGSYTEVDFKGPDEGALVFTGPAPTVTLGTSGSRLPAAGTLTLAGQAVTLVVPPFPSAGPLTLTGQTPSLVLGYGTPAGTLTLSGQSVTVARFGGSLAVAEAVLALTGTTPGVVQAGGPPVLIITPTRGVVTLTGPAPVLAFSINPDVPRVSLIGSDEPSRTLSGRFLRKLFRKGQVV